MIHNRAGATLISALIAMTIIATCLVAVLQAYMHGSRFVSAQEHRARASAACRQQIEAARAGGFASLPPVGRHLFPIADEPEPSGQLIVTDGPFPGSRVLTAQATWPTSDRMGAGQVELSAVVTARGISP